MKTISLKCRSCGGVLNVNADRDILCCPYCGSKQLIPESDDIKKQRIKSEAYKNVEYEKQRTYREIELEREKTKRDVELEKQKTERKKEYSDIKKLFLGLVAIIIFFVVWGVFYNSLSDSDSSTVIISVPNSAKHYKGEQYQSVIVELRDAGFMNIQAQGLKDLKNGLEGLFKKEGTIEKISINGVTDFKKDDRFDANATIRITYHSASNVG